jgi:hypothetical protein
LKHVAIHLYNVIKLAVLMVLNNYFVIYATQWDVKDKNYVRTLHNMCIHLKYWTIWSIHCTYWCTTLLSHRKKLSVHPMFREILQSVISVTEHNNATVDEIWNSSMLKQVAHTVTTEPSTIQVMWLLCDVKWHKKI